MKVSSTFDGPFLAIPKWAAQKAQKKPSALQVLCALVEHMDIRTKTSTVTISQLAEGTDTSPATVRRATKWLEDEGIIETKKCLNGANSYTVIYERGVSPVTGGAITSDRGGLSPVTGGAIMGDTPKQPKNSHLPGETQNPIEVYRESNKEKEKRVSDEGSDMILGSDPEASGSTTEKPKRTKDSELKPLVEAFCYHQSRVMSARYSPQEIVILKHTLRRMLKNGMTPQTIHRMIDTFLSDTRFQNYTDLVKAFSSNKVQKTLLDRIGADVTDDDPVLMLMANDFVREDQDIPWDPPADDLLRRITTRHCLEALFRYPELVAGLATHWQGFFEDQGFISALQALDDLVKVGLGMSSLPTDELLEELQMLQVPQDLLSGTVRPSAGTIKEAIYNYRRAVHA